MLEHTFNISIIQEFLMIEPAFKIKHTTNQNTDRANANRCLYSQLLQNFINQSYGYYTQVFIDRISKQAITKFEFLLKFDLKKIFRQTIKKLLLSDLQLIFLSYFCNKHLWNINNEVIQANQLLITSNLQQIEQNKLRIFLLLVGFFIKDYLNDKVESETIKNKLDQEFKQFGSVYSQWTHSNPPQYFTISPKQINKLYTQYSRNNQKGTKKRDYNQMVDRILQLSTTYSIMPTSVINNKKNKKIKKNQSLSSFIKVPNSNIINKTQRNASIPSGPSDEKSLIQQPNFSFSNLSGRIWNLRSNRSSNSDRQKEANNLSISNLFNSQLSKQPSKEQNPLRQKKQTITKKKLTRKHPNQINTTVMEYFKKNSGITPIVQESRDNLNLLDSNVRSSKYSSLPFNIRQGSYMFGSQLF